MKAALIRFWAGTQAKGTSLGWILAGVVLVVGIAGLAMLLYINYGIQAVNAHGPTPASPPPPTSLTATTSTSEPTTTDTSETTSLSPAPVESSSPSTPSNATPVTTTVAPIHSQTAPHAVGTYCRLEAGNGVSHYTKQAGPAADPDWIEADQSGGPVAWADSGFPTWQRVDNGQVQIQDSRSGRWVDADTYFSTHPTASPTAEDRSRQTFNRLWSSGLSQSPPCQG